MIFNNRECRDQCRALTLKLMSDSQIRKRQEIYQEVIRRGEFSDEVLDLRFDFGQSKVENAIAWAITSLTKAGILNRISKATYQITPTGLKMAQLWQDKTEISEKLYSEVDLPEWESYLKSRVEIKDREKQSDDIMIAVSDNDEIDFETQAKNAIKEIETEIAVELLNKLQQGTPLFFEKAVLKLLLAMGYGGKENLFEHTGKSHDGGIDGVIKQDPLGIQNIYIQAKRYASENSVGSKELQSFLGALQGNGVDRGVFITTSSFTKSAKEYTQKLLGRIVLIDGKELVTLMIKYKVGTQIKEVLEICEIDEDFFE
ncbi:MULTISPECIES: restriction endonuclease [unclassified Moraxella]|uniref:restriction endonuclease n=1 Tax=unclassified Moraxella TaxID=2685852 RepID=UPI002B408110|nr:MULTISPECIES: restriction endonuclease [unclassified Moraxella]